MTEISKNLKRQFKGAYNSAQMVQFCYNMLIHL